MKFSNNYKNIAYQRGATLVVSLAILVIITLLGVTAMRTSVFEEKMSSNLQDKQLSFQASESTLREGEAWLLTLTGEPVPVTSCSSYPCVLTHDPSREAWGNSHSWWQSNSAAFTGTMNQVNALPRFIVEYERFVPDDLTIGHGVPPGMQYYRVTGRGTGGSDETVTVLESTLPRRF